MKNSSFRVILWPWGSPGLSNSVGKDISGIQLISKMGTLVRKNGDVFTVSLLFNLFVIVITCYESR